MIPISNYTIGDVGGQKQCINRPTTFVVVCWARSFDLLPWTIIEVHAPPRYVGWFVLLLWSFHQHKTEYNNNHIDLKQISQWTGASPCNQHPTKELKCLAVSLWTKDHFVRKCVWTFWSRAVMNQPTTTNRFTSYAHLADLLLNHVEPPQQWCSPFSGSLPNLEKKNMLNHI